MFATITKSFDPEAASLMKQAFDSAWRTLKASGSVDTQAYRAEWARETLALRIIDEVHDGKRDVQALQTDALAHLSQTKFRPEARHGNYAPATANPVSQGTVANAAREAN